MQRFLDAIRALDGVVELAPDEGSEYPEIAWGDHFFYYSRDGTVPQNVQPFATIITKDYPDDTGSRLDPPGRWRLNLHVGAPTMSELFGDGVDDLPELDRSEADLLVPHPVYAQLGWVAVINPGDRTTATVLELVRAAHADERRRVDRRAGGSPRPPSPGDDL
jgi:hypothetical protein